MDSFDENSAPWYSSHESIKAVVIEDGVTAIGSHAFSYCSSLESVEIPSSVTPIQRGVFAACSSLESVTIQYSVNYIGDYAFYSCSNLKHIFVDSSIGEVTTGDPWCEDETTVHWRHIVVKEASPEAGGTVEVEPASSSGMYWDADPSTLGPTVITVVATPKPGYYLSKLTYEIKDSATQSPFPGRPRARATHSSTGRGRATSLTTATRSRVTTPSLQCGRRCRSPRPTP